MMTREAAREKAEWELSFIRKVIREAKESADVTYLESLLHCLNNHSMVLTMTLELAKRRAEKAQPVGCLTGDCLEARPVGRIEEE